MSIESIILFDNSISDSTVSASFVFTEKNKGAGYHKKQDNLHTAVYAISNFTGTVKLQGTLSLYPGNDDWFDIEDSVINFVDAVEQAYTFNFRGNFLWIRAAFTVEQGSVNQIRYNY